MSAVVRTERLTRSFGENRGVFDLDFEVRQGEVFGFLGPNGAGKSTTIRLLLGLYRRSSGRALVFGLDSHRDTVKIHSRVGYLPGELELHQRLTGAAHLDVVAKARGLTDMSYRDELIERFGVELDKPVHTLSKGNRQKVGLVLALMHRPELLVLDEPTSGLDPLLQYEFAKLIRETVAEGRTVFLSSHELEEVQRVVDRLAIIKEGRIAVTDTVEGLRRTAPRTVELRFEHPVDPDRFSALEGVHISESSEDRIVLSVTGALGPLLALAGELDPFDIVARQADLDELFLSYYRSEASAPDQTPAVNEEAARAK